VLITLTISIMSEVNSIQTTSKRILPQSSNLHENIILAVKSMTRINHGSLMCAVGLLFAIKG